MPENSIQTLVEWQRKFFASGATLDLRFREQALRSLLDALRDSEREIYFALRADLGKSAGEAYITELGLVSAEINFTLKHLKRWARPRRAATPLAAYIFTSSRKNAGQIITRMPFGGGCVNDTLLHMSNPGLPFGGVGLSGLGSYHGRYGFDLFSNLKGVLHKSGRPDLPLRHPPYTESKLNWIKRFLR